MSNIRDEFDVSNIPGAKLAEIGRNALLGEHIIKREIQKGLTIQEAYEKAKSMLDGRAKVENPPKIKEGDYTNTGWLDMRVEEICRKGRL